MDITFCHSNNARLQIGARHDTFGSAVFCVVARDGTGYTRADMQHMIQDAQHVFVFADKLFYNVSRLLKD